MFTLVLVAVVATLVCNTTLNQVWAGALLSVGCLINVAVTAACEKKLLEKTNSW
jgi:hypothetical protein